jgi:molecular chaperone DnaJ
MAERAWLETDYYKALGVPSTATDKEITRAYRKLAKAHHPDTNPGSEERFKEISSAYDVLGDAAKRKEYDEVRRLGPLGGAFSGGPGGFQAGGTTFTMGDLGDFGDLLGGLFGRGRGRGPRRGGDLEAALHLSFEDAVRGVTTAVHLPTDAMCRKCKGSGAAPGTTPVQCERCHGRGVLDDDKGMFSLSTVCPVCQGRGSRIETPCPSCHGSGREASSRSVKVRIPAGVEGGQRIRVKGKGQPGANGAPSGDLYVVVHVARDARFGRRGRNLTSRVPISFADATLGTKVAVPTLDGPVTMRVPAGTSPGTTLRVRGRGVPAHGSTAAGDLLVTVDVTVPKDLTDEQRAAVETMAKSLDGAAATTTTTKEDA